MQTSLTDFEAALERQLELWQGLQRQQQLLSRQKLTGGHGHLHGSSLQTFAGALLCMLSQNTSKYIKGLDATHSSWQCLTHPSPSSLFWRRLVCPKRELDWPATTRRSYALRGAIAACRMIASPSTSAWNLSKPEKGCPGLHVCTFHLQYTLHMQLPSNPGCSFSSAGSRHLLQVDTCIHHLCKALIWLQSPAHSDGRCRLTRS